MDRRTFLTRVGRAALATAAASPAAAALPACARVPAARGPHIVLRSSWQSINIGDVAHTPGALALLERYLPEARVTLWAASMDRGVRALLARRFPGVAIQVSAVNRDPPPAGAPAGIASDDGHRGNDARTRDERAAALRGTALAELLASADLVLHGSGPSIVSPDALYAARSLRRPYGIYGVTLAGLEGALRQAAGGARFFYCRDTDSLRYLEQLDLPCPVQAFAPDATFAVDLRDDAAVARELAALGLVDRQFLCVITRLRWTPYPGIVAAAGKGDREARAKLAENDRCAKPDNAKLREAIVTWVRETGFKVLLCPEMTYEVPLLRPLLYDPLPEAVKPSVVVRDRYWLTDAAASTYARAAAVLSCEMHSPIIAVAQGTPAIHLRQPTDTRKGQMWRDIGLDEWLFEIDETDGAAIAARTVRLVSDAAGTQARLRAAMARVRARQEESMAVVKQACGA